ncbi:MAG: ribosome maturation factor RimM [Steroidobacteraceae bacterium]
MPARRLTLGRIAAPHGVQGWVKVDSFTDPPEALLERSTWCLQNAAGELQDCTLKDGQIYGRQLRVRLQGIEDRDAAALLTGRQIVIERDALPPTGEREYYRDDLIGLRVTNLEGVAFGTVSHFVEGATVLMVVRGERERWLPAGEPCLRRVDLANGEVKVDWPADL